MTQATAPVARIRRSAAALGKKLVDVSAQTADYVSEYGGFPYFYVVASAAGDITFVDALGNLSTETFTANQMANASAADRRPVLPLLCKRVVALAVFNEEAALFVSGGTGAGATVASVSVNNTGQITAIEWESGGLGYVVGDILTLFQDYQTATYTVLTADVDADGVLQDLSGKTLASTTAATGVDFYAVYGP